MLNNVVSINKNKGDRENCTNCEEIKLISLKMKVQTTVTERRYWSIKKRHWC